MMEVSYATFGFRVKSLFQEQLVKNTKVMTFYLISFQLGLLQRYDLI